MLGKIKALTKIFIKDFFQNTKLINKETRKLNTKSIYFWIIIVISIAVIYISYKSIEWFSSTGEPEIFINFFVMFLTILLMFQITLICTNVFFFSKDLEFILPLPIKSKDLLMAKFNVILFLSYMTEIVLGLTPLILYGLLNHVRADYFIWVVLLLVLLPIIFISTIGLFSIILMKIFSFVKNKTVLQNIISTILILLLFLIEYLLIGDTSNLGETNYFVKPIIQILTGISVIEKIKYFIFLLILDIIALITFLFIGQKLYLKTLLKNLTINAKKKFNLSKKRQVKILDRKVKLGKEYLKKELIMLSKQPIFFMQTVLPVIIVLISIIMLANVLIPAIDSTIEENDTIKNSIASLEFNSEMICVILGILQCLFSLSSISVTAISRDGKNAIFMKYIPVSYYRQFLYKNLIQIVLNIVVAIVVLSVIYFYIPKIGLINIILMFIISIFINLINSYLMVLVDLRRPYLTWNSEYSVVKKNDNKSFQYALTIIMILAYMYLSSIFKNINVTLTLLIENFIFMILFIILDRLIKNKSEKLFDKII